MRVAHVAPYPPKGEKHVLDSGVASYTKNLVSHMSGHENIVISNKAGNDVEYTEDEVKVHRSFDRNFRFLWQVHRVLKKEQPDVVHMQQELALFGGPLTAYLQQWLVFLWRQRTVVTLHGVVDLKKIDKKFVKENSYHLPVWLVKIALWIIFAPITRYARQIIVHEQHFKNILVRRYGADARKIDVIPHGIETFTVNDRDEARTELQLPKESHLVLYMGYATGYKGIDLLIEGFAEFARRDAKAFLVIGAGEHPRVKDTQEYQQKYAAWRQKAARLIPAGQYRWEGFIAEGDITPFYSAADVAVFPYTAALASSGPMSVAIGHGRPFLASSAFGQIFDEKILFKKTSLSMAEKLETFFANRLLYEKYARLLHNERAWGPVAQQTMAVYNQITEEEDEIEERIIAG